MPWYPGREGGKEEQDYTYILLQGKASTVHNRELSWGANVTGLVIFEGCQHCLNYMYCYQANLHTQK